MAAPSTRVSAMRRRPKGRVIEVNDLFYNLPARRKFLKSDWRRVGAGLAAGHAAGAGVSRGRLHADERRRAVLECPPAATLARAALSDLRRSRRPGAGRPQGRRRRAPERASSRRWPSRADARAPARLHQSPHRQGQDDRARHHRRLQPRPRSRSAVLRCTCSSRCRPTRSTSTCTRPRRKCASPTSRSCTRSCGAASPRRWAQPACPTCRAARLVRSRTAARSRGSPARSTAGAASGRLGMGRARAGRQRRLARASTDRLAPTRPAGHRRDDGGRHHVGRRARARAHSARPVPRTRSSSPSTTKGW